MTSLAAIPGIGDVRALVGWPKAGLPRAARLKIDDLRDEAAGLHASLMVASDDVRDLIQRKAEAEAELRRAAETYAPLSRVSEEDVARHLEPIREKIADMAERIARQVSVRDERAARWQQLRGLVDALDAYTAGKSAFRTGPSGTRPKADPAKAVEKLRRRIEELRVEYRQAEAAPITEAEALAKATAEIDALAERGRPDVLRLVEHGEGIDWPTVTLHGPVIGYGEHRAIPSVPTVNAHALFAFIHRDALLKAVADEIRRSADPAAALSDADRAKRMTEIEAAILAAERDEEAAIEAAAEAGVPILRRRDADPRAVLGLADDMPAPHRT